MAGGCCQGACWIYAVMLRMPHASQSTRDLMGEMAMGDMPMLVCMYCKALIVKSGPALLHTSVQSLIRLGGGAVVLHLMKKTHSRPQRSLAWACLMQ